MLIDGRAISDRLLESLIPRVVALKKLGRQPTLAIIQIGNNPSSLSYIYQKQKTARAIGVKIDLKKFEVLRTINNLNATIDTLITDKHIHGIILQRPLPQSVSENFHQLHRIPSRKDVDGFVEKSPFNAPVAAAVVLILREIFEAINPNASKKSDSQFVDWIQNQKITIVGKGITAGAPILKQLRYHNTQVISIDTKTKDTDQKLKASDIIISCAGKPNIVRRDNMKPDSILISVGIWKDSNGKLHGDYNEAEIASKAKFYTSTPGGVGPVNVACLMQNVVTAAENFHPLT